MEGKKMSQITGRERVLAAFNREYLDRVPICIASAMNCVEEAGYSLEDFLLDDDIAMKVTAKSLELFPSDMVRVPGDPTLPIIAEARFRKKHGENARMEPILKDKSRINEISFQDPKKSPSYRKYLDLCRISAMEFGERAVQALFPGPWSGAANFRGVEAIIIDTMDDPEFVHRLMRITTDLAKQRGLALMETGVLMVVAGDPSASCSLISPKIYREFIKPYHKELMDHLKEEGSKRKVFAGLHICGYIDPIMEDLVDVEPDFIEIDGPSSLKRMVEVSKRKVVIRGNIRSELFLQGEREDMDNAVKECIETAAKGSAYILSHGCALPPNAPLERIRWYMEAGLRYGRY
jgi:uroporphyrinogen decarboxylase